MPQTALAIASEAYRTASMDQPLEGFTPSADFPYNIALELLNKVLAEINRKGPLWFMAERTPLPYQSGPGYDLTALGVDQRRIVSLNRTANNQGALLKQLEWNGFYRQYRTQQQAFGQPVAWAKFNGVLELNCAPDRDYALELTHYKPLPRVAVPDEVLPIPDHHIDVVVQGVYAYLLDRLGRQDATMAMTEYREGINEMLADVKSDAGLPRAMPRCW